jgi:hypothetical protein
MRVIRSFSILLPMFISCASIAACGGGGTSSTTTVQQPPQTPEVPLPIVLRNLYRVVVNGTDRMTTFGPNERATYPLEGQVYYVPDASLSDRTLLNRLVNSSGTDHADAVGPLNGYTVDEPIGYPWSASSAGLTQILEALNSLKGDYAMVAPTENIPGYVSMPLPVYGYPRYGGALEVLLTLSAGGVTAESNAVAGGAVWRWTWNGTEFLNNHDYGRLIQSDFYYASLQNSNPDEAGDAAPVDISNSNSLLSHGSPILSFQNNGTTQSTRSIPLNWLPSPFGGDDDHPVIWNQMVLGKELTLNFNDLGSVAQYTTHMVLPVGTTGTFEAPVMYLRSNFNHFWTYDAPSKVLNDVTGLIPNGCTPNSPGFVFTPHFGGAILSDAAGDNAMGMYGVDDANGGSVNFFNLSNFECNGDGPAETAFDTVALAAVKGGEGGNDNNFVFPAGESTYNVYIITDSLQNVAAQMDKLYNMGVK